MTVLTPLPSSTICRRSWSTTSLHTATSPAGRIAPDPHGRYGPASAPSANDAAASLNVRLAPEATATAMSSSRSAMRQHPTEPGAPHGTESSPSAARAAVRSVGARPELGSSARRRIGMTARRASAIAAVALGLWAVGCGPSGRATTGPSADTGGSGTTSMDGPVAPPPAEVIEATVVHFDPDSTATGTGASSGRIDDAAGLAAFVARSVDGDPALGTAARDALRAGQVLIGGPVSTGCVPAEGAILAFTATDIRLLPVGLGPEDPDVECVRVVTSTALVAVDADALPQDCRSVTPDLAVGPSAGRVAVARLRSLTAPALAAVALVVGATACRHAATGDGPEAWCAQLDVAVVATARLDELGRDDPDVDTALAAVQDEMAALADLDAPPAIAADWAAVSAPPVTDAAGRRRRRHARRGRPADRVVGPAVGADLSAPARAALDGRGGG